MGLFCALQFQQELHIWYIHIGQSFLKGPKHDILYEKGRFQLVKVLIFLLTNQNTDYGCCKSDGQTPANGPNQEGCPEEFSCLLTAFGCCPDNKTPALGINYKGCLPACESSQYGCCLDGETMALGKYNSGILLPPSGGFLKICLIIRSYIHRPTLNFWRCHLFSVQDNKEKHKKQILCLR